MISLQKASPQRLAVLFSGCLLLLLCLWGNAHAQGVSKSPARREIDAKRTVLDLYSEEAGPRSREFLRIDSTYYVGWLIEGVFKFERAADVTGFKAAARSLETCLRHLERDYARQLRTRTTDLAAYLAIYPLQTDYALATSTLVQCYNNLEQAQQSYNTIRRYLQWDFQRDFFDPYNMLMWVVHRNRIYTAAKYPFLQNSIDANEALAARYLDTAILRIRRSERANAAFFTPESYQSEYIGVYHYKAILYSYIFAMDSAQHYYELLRESGRPTHNNYANFRSIAADFPTAQREYALAGMIESGDNNRLQEWAYFSSILNIYEGQPKAGIQLMKEMVESHLSQPGYGWYQIAKARCEAYDGQVAQAEKTLKKASEFRELHIGTSLGQTQYDFAIGLQKLYLAQRRTEMIKFENRGWWYRPTALWEMAKRKSLLTLQRFLIINQLARNPERDRVLYKVFSTESVVGWDEIRTLISGFSTKYFLKKFQPQITTDNRPAVRKYFRYLTAMLLMQKGDAKGAQQLLTTVRPDNGETDPETETLLWARKSLALAQLAADADEDKKRDEYLMDVAALYPQLLPFSEMRIPMRLKVEGTEDKAVMKRLKKCNLELNPANGIALIVSLRFEEVDSGARRVYYSAATSDGRQVVAPQVWAYEKKNPDAAGIELAYRIFGVNGKLPESEEAQVAGY